MTDEGVVMSGWIFLIIIVAVVGALFFFTVQKDRAVDKQRKEASELLLRKVQLSKLGEDPKGQSNHPILRSIQTYAASYSRLLEYERKPDTYRPDLVDIDLYIQEIQTSLCEVDESGNYAPLKLALSKRQSLFPLEKGVIKSMEDL